MQILSRRRFQPDPVLRAFADLTHAWLDDQIAHHERTFREPWGGGTGALLACDVLIALHGHDASWQRFDVVAFETYVRERIPSLAPAIPAALCDLAWFVTFLADRGRLSPERAEATVARVRELVGGAPRRPNRHERRASAARRRRRTN